MDRRQQKTRAAIFDAFCALLAEQPYHKITVQEIIDRANVGRTTFYAHFETKDDLLRALCQELFRHIVDRAVDATHTHGQQGPGDAPRSVFWHLLRHLQENDHNILGLLSGQSSQLFLEDFKGSLEELVRTQVVEPRVSDTSSVPRDFLVNHIAGSFVEMVLWWIRGRMKQTPEELDAWFQAVMDPILI